MNREEYLSECDCCGKMKYGCRDVWISYAGDTHACPQCLDDDDPAADRGDWEFHRDHDR